MPLGTHIKPSASLPELVQQLGITLQELLKDGEGKPFVLARVEDARVVTFKPRPAPAGAPAAPAMAPSIVFKVSEGDARQLCKARTQLAGKGITISDWLSPAEMQRRRALMPQSVKAREAKIKTYWRRDKLFVDGKEVHPPSTTTTPVAPAVAAA
jgi:hypothetical protein